MATTFSALVSMIPLWTNNTDSDELVAETTSIIYRVTERMSRDIDTVAFRKTSQSTTTPSDPFLNLPSDNVLVRSVALLDASGTANFLQKKPVEYCLAAYPSRSATGSVRYYADWDETTLLMAPTPASAKTVELRYTYRLATLSASNETNWLTQHASDALFYGCVSEAYRFLQDEQRADYYFTLYQDQISVIQREADKEKVDEYYYLRVKEGI